jgi:hypothetical protein
MIANFNHNHQKIFGASWKAVVVAFPVVWGKKVGRGDTTECRTYPCTQVQFGFLRVAVVTPLNTGTEKSA